MQGLVDCNFIVLRTVLSLGKASRNATFDQHLNDLLSQFILAEPPRARRNIQNVNLSMGENLVMTSGYALPTPV